MIQTGIPVIGDVPWGTHFCQFYRDKQDLIDILVPYFKAGLETNECCMWVTSDPLNAAEAKAALALQVDRLDDRIAAGQLEILDYRDWYTREGKFDSDRVLEAWVDRLDAARKRGFAGLRLTGNTFWLEKAEWSGFTAYEAAVDAVIGSRRMLALCTYSLEKCGAAEIMDVVSNHAFALIRRGGDWQIIESAERKRAAAALTETNDRLRMAIDSVGLGAWEYEIATGTFTCSELCAIQFGLPGPGRVDYSVFLQALHPDDRDRIHRIFQDALQSRARDRIRAEFRILGIQDGVERWLVGVGRVHFDPDGRPVRALGTTLDFTEQRRTHEELLRYREWLGAALSSIVDAVVATDLHGAITFLNPVAALLLGWHSEEALGRPVGEVLTLVDERTGGPAENIVERVLREGSPSALANHSAIVSRDGRVIPVEDSAAPIRDGAGNVAGCVVVFHDVTAKRRSQEALARSERKYRNLFRNMTEEVHFWKLVRDENGEIQTWVLEDANPPALRTWGKSLEDIRGKTADEIFGAGAAAHYMPVVRRIMTEGVPYAYDDYFPHIDRYFRFTSVPLGEYFITTGADITAIQKAHEDVLRSEARWNAALENLGEGLIIATEAGQVIYWNPAARAMHGFTTPGEGIGPLAETPNTFQLWTPDGGHLLSLDEWPMPRIMRGEIVRDMELRLRRPDQGWERIVSYSGAMAETAGGERLVYLSVYDLTQQRKAEQAAREGERKFQQVLESLPQMIWTCSADGLCDYLSPQWLRYTGRPEAVQLGYGWLEQVHPDDRVRVATAWQGATTRGENYSVEFRIRRHDGEYRWFHTLGLPLRDNRGRIAKWFGTNTDVHDSKIVEQVLRQSRLDLDRAQTVGQIGSWRLDTRRNVLSWSPENYRIFGISHGTPLTYESFLDCIHPDDRAGVDRKWKAGLRGEPYDIEHRLLVDGRVKWVREKAYLEFDDAGVLLGGFGITQDITERKRAEEKIRHQNTILEALNRIFAKCLHAENEEELGRTCLAIAEDVTGSRFGFIAEVRGDAKLHVISVSDPGWDACRISGATERGSIDKLQIRGVYSRAVLDGRGLFTNDVASHPDRVGLPAGHPPVTALLAAPLKHDGETIGLIAVANREGGYREADLQCLEALAMAVVQVFMRNRAEQAARVAEDHLRHAQKMESIGLLAGGIAHDFNNLLTSILGNASLLQMDLGSKAREIRTIMHSSEKAAALTRQLLAYAGKGKFQVADFDVARLLRSCPDLIRVSIPKSIEIVVDVPRNLPAVNGDSTQIQQVIMNLMINAAEAIGDRADGKVSIRAAVHTLDPASASRIDAAIPPGRYIELSVKDNGCGMTRETIANIFDPFFTTKFTGRGLGLAAVHGILASHKGAITVESEPGRGSCFTVYLPCRSFRAAAQPRHRPSAKRRGLTVLVVDDESDICDYAKTALERFGHKVLIANNGSEALTVLRSHREVRLVLLDIVMPILGGAETLSEIRTHWPDLAVLVTSGYSEQEAHRLGIPDGAPFLPKPFTAKALADAIETGLRPAPALQS